MIQKELDKSILSQAQILWDYLRLGQPLKTADCIIAMGSHDLRVGEYAAQLVLEGWAPLLICSGGLGRLTQEIWGEPEALKFAQIAKAMGVPDGKILIEDESSNTAQNLQFSRDLIEKEEIIIHSAILVHKPYMERRVLATAEVVWPELTIVISSPPIGFMDYSTKEISLDEVIQIMVGDFQRIMVYAEKGYQTRQEIPCKVMSAFSTLVEAGFDHHCI